MIVTYLSHILKNIAYNDSYIICVMQVFDIYHIFSFLDLSQNMSSCLIHVHISLILYFGAGTTWSQAVGSDLTLLVQHQEPVAEDTQKNGFALIQRELELIFMIFFI